MSEKRFCLGCDADIEDDETAIEVKVDVGGWAHQNLGCLRDAADATRFMDGDRTCAGCGTLVIPSWDMMRLPDGRLCHDDESCLIKYLIEGED